MKNEKHKNNKNKVDPKRLQLTLFIEENEAQSIEIIRRKFNPLQYDLIKAHVTLCREDELENIDAIMLNLEKLNKAHVNIDFGDVVRFSEGNGVLIPALDDNESFQKLRAAILEGIIEQPRKHAPHITLMHPRNSTCTDSIFEQIIKVELPKKLTFKKISVIEQELGKEWQILSVFELKKPH